MATVLVQNNAGLLAALKTIHGGDTILLASGNYTPINVLNVHVNGNATITSQDPMHPAVLGGLIVNGSSGLTFTKLSFSAAGARLVAAFGVYNSTNVMLSSINAYGAGPTVQATGFVVEKSSNVVITGSTFTNLMNGISELNNTNITMSNNKFSNIGGDGIDNGGSSNVVVSNNTFSNFEPAGTQHSDAIQFWTTNTTTSASNISIAGNTITQGANPNYQGIFMSDQVGSLPYQNVKIENNNVDGGLWNGIELQHATNVTMSGNTVTSTGDGSASSPLARILLLDTTSAVVSNNIAAQFVYNANDSLITMLGNKTNTFAAAATGKLSGTAPILAVSEHGSVSGQVSLVDVAGANPVVAKVSSNTVTSAGITLSGTYGKLTMHSNGSYSYVASAAGLQPGKLYADTFNAVISDSQGHSTSTFIQFQVSPSTTGAGGTSSVTSAPIHTGLPTLLTGANTMVDTADPDDFVYTSLSQGVANNHPTIIGFKAGDVIDLSQIDPQFQVVSAFDHHAHELMIHNDGNGAWDVYGDTTGSGVANFSLHLTGVTTPLTSASFHL